MTPAMRVFETGATRNVDDGKYDYEGFLNPLVLERFARYMQEHSTQADGALRPGDNWQRGMPRDAYMKSLWRHFHAMWMIHRGYEVFEDWGQVSIEDAICAQIFNLQGYLLEHLRAEGLAGKPAEDESAMPAWAAEAVAARNARFGL